jgi:hypothetical protein
VLRCIKYIYSNSVSWGKDDFILFSIIFIITYSVLCLAQDQSYWENAPVGKSKIFTISFTDKENGLAQTADGIVLLTEDGGKSWTEKPAAISSDGNSNSEMLWKADIYCAIMKTTDGGNSWTPYEDGKQEHFCGVYLKDENTSYKVASEFLYKVTVEINYCFINNKLDSLIDQPKQCTEYYRNPEEGWALGWCVRNFSN